ncbi:MAG: AAA family ATPase [Rhodobacter sp.]|jgi:predicted ATPase|nr:AAA family ATPase [Rhodobacter sp.]
MRITGIDLKNWRNFKSASVTIQTDVVYLVGPNASGKSNFLDALRFVRDIAKPIGGGLQTALKERGGFSKIRCLHSRGNRAGGGTDLIVKLSLEDNDVSWVYDLGINFPKSSSRDIPQVVHEKVSRNGTSILDRPKPAERDDPEQLAVTYLEQAAQNGDFRSLATFFAAITYVHLVPQLVKFGERISGHLLPDDPFGQAFMKRIADTAPRTRDARLKKISEALKGIVPGLEGLAFEKDGEGRPHIEMRYQTYRQHPARQLEDQLSDGTLRLIALLWLLQEKHIAPLLLEEPELSLNEEIVRKLHRIFHKISRRANHQLFVTTHSYALLSNPGIAGESIFKVEPGNDGSRIVGPTEAEMNAIKNGVPPADVVLSKEPQLAFDI